MALLELCLSFLKYHVVVTSEVAFALCNLSYTSKYASGNVDYLAGHYTSLIHYFLLQSWGRKQERTGNVSCAPSIN